MCKKISPRGLFRPKRQQSAVGAIGQCREKSRGWGFTGTPHGMHRDHLGFNGGGVGIREISKVCGIQDLFLPTWGGVSSLWLIGSCGLAEKLWLRVIFYVLA